MFSITTFSELLKGLPRSAFEKVVKKHNADKYCKRFRHWDQLIAMLYAQLSGASSLRALESGFNSQRSHHFHLGTGHLKRSTLADANEKRADTVFSDVAASLMAQVARRDRGDCDDLMYLLDSTSITLKGREFDRWTAANRTRNTQGIKVHVLMDSHSQAPAWHNFSAPNVNDVEMARHVPLQAGALYVFDKGYCHYNWWNDIDAAGARFVTRFKRNAGLIVLEDRAVDETERSTILQDQVVKFKTKYPGARRVNRYSTPLRCITVARPNKDTPLVLATNDLVASASEIAQRYKERWGIELFFKWVKQHLKIKQFIGRTENAVRIQVLTALISYLLVALYKQRNGKTQTLWECLCVISATLFQRIEAEDSRYRRRKAEAAHQIEIQPCLF